MNKFKNFPPVYCISLSDSSDRRCYMKGQCDALGIEDLTFIECYDGRGVDFRQTGLVQGNFVHEVSQGAIATTGADQGLLVAYGGVNKQTRELLGNQQFKIKVWDADGLIEALLASYAKLDGEIAAEIPLKQVWTLVVSDD